MGPNPSLPKPTGLFSPSSPQGTRDSRRVADPPPPIRRRPPEIGSHPLRGPLLPPRFGTMTNGRAKNSLCRRRRRSGMGCLRPAGPCQTPTDRQGGRRRRRRRGKRKSTQTNQNQTEAEEEADEEDDEERGPSATPEERPRRRGRLRPMRSRRAETPWLGQDVCCAASGLGASSSLFSRRSYSFLRLAKGDPYGARRRTLARARMDGYEGGRAAS